MFGEEAPLYAKLYKELEDCELLIIIGTSGHVIDVDSLTRYAKKTILNNLEPSDAIDDSLYTKVLYKKATDAIDEIEAEIKKEFYGI
jgi:NAD-dependent deacetylase